MRLDEIVDTNGMRFTDLKIDGKSVLLRGRRRDTWTGDFQCSFSNLVSLEGAPISVSGIFSCSNNRLTSLEGAPTKVGKMFSCSHNGLTDLVHAPMLVGAYFNAAGNNIASLEGIHRQIKCVRGKFYAADNPITSRVLGLLLIEGVTLVELDNGLVTHTLNKHLTSGRSGLIPCQNELLDAGLEEYAKL